MNDATMNEREQLRQDFLYVQNLIRNNYSFVHEEFPERRGEVMEILERVLM